MIILKNFLLVWLHQERCVIKGTTQSKIMRLKYWVTKLKINQINMNLK